MAEYLSASSTSQQASGTFHQKSKFSVTLVPSRLKLAAYCAAAPTEAYEFAGLVANFFFAVSTQLANS